jgi:hypothetical protein
MLEVKLAIVDKLEIMYEGVFEGNEAIMLVWLAFLEVEHYWWLQGMMFQIKAKYKAELFVYIVHHILKFL